MASPYVYQYNAKQLTSTSKYAPQAKGNSGFKQNKRKQSKGKK